MFFSPEILQKRDSGFGLLWLAATLGPQSVFRKLPKRSVVSADIAELCDQIAEPEEPLALRLSSNLMIGVVRVYKGKLTQVAISALARADVVVFSPSLVKQEILMADVTACTNSIKKMAHDIMSPMHLQMAQQALKESALSAPAHPSQAFALEFDNMVADWDEYLNIDKSIEDQDNYEDSLHGKQKKKGKARPPPSTEVPRADAHTLPPSHEDTFSLSMDFAMDPSSSQQDGSFHPDMEAFPTDDLDLILPPDWRTVTNPIDENPPPGTDSPQGIGALADTIDVNPFLDVPMDLDNGDKPFPEIPEMDAFEEEPIPIEEPVTSHKRKQPGDADIENPFAAVEDEDGPGTGAAQMQDAADAFSREFLSQDEPLDNRQEGITQKNPKPAAADIALRKAKKPRLLIDARIELTDEELKASRAEYIKQQRMRRRQMTHKRNEKEDAQSLEHVLLAVPLGIQATTLIDFWQSHVKLHIENRAGKDAVAHPADKRTRPVTEEAPQAAHDREVAAPEPFMPFEEELGMDLDFLGNDNPLGENHLPERENRHDPSIRSSEEPEQARRGSRPPLSTGSQTRFRPQNQDQDLSSASQRSALLPWDFAAPSSASNDIPFDDGSASYRLHDGSAHRRSSFDIQASHLSSRTGLSPAAKGHSQMLDEDFAFDIPQAEEQQTLEDTQQSNAYSAALEKNSHNFLEYAKMQLQSLQASSTGTTGLPFDTVAPKSTSTRQVAAAAFYHCLALATKDLLRVEQTVPHGPITLHIF